MPTHNNTPSDPETDLTARDTSSRDGMSSLPPGRGATITQIGQAIRLVKFTAPLHPILVHFTIALTVTSFAFDLLAFLCALHVLVAIGWWMLVAAILVTILTIATGVQSRLRWPVEEGEARSFLRAHMALGPTLFGMLTALGIWRGELWQAGSHVTWWYLAAMAGVTVVTAAQGYLGGELVYRYGAEVKFHYCRLAGHRQPFPEPTIVGRAGAPTRRL